MDFHKVDVVGGALTSLQAIEAEALDPYQHTAFGEARVSLPYTLADFISKYGRNPLDLQSFTSGGGIVADVVSSSAFRLTCGAPNALAQVRSNSYFRYQSGRGLKITHTVVMEFMPRLPTDFARYGFFDDNDGVFWEWTANGLGAPFLNLVVRSSTSGVPVETRVAYAAADNPIALDGTKGNIYEIQFQWLGVGAIQFFINGTLVHTIENANLNTVPYMRTADLPIAWETRHGAAASGFNTQMLCICGNVTVQSGQNPPEYGFGVERDAFLGGIGAAYVPLLAIRLAAALNGVDNRSIVYPKRVIVSCETSRAAFRVLLNPTTLTGAVFNPVGGNSCMEFDIAATAFTGGEYLTGDFLPNTADSRNLDLSEIFSVNARKMRRSSFAPGTSDVLLVVGRNEAAGTATMRAGLQWAEVR